MIGCAPTWGMLVSDKVLLLLTDTLLWFMWSILSLKNLSRIGLTCSSATGSISGNDFSGQQNAQPVDNVKLK